MKPQIDERKMFVLIDKFISEAEIKTGSPIKEHERILLKIMGRLLTEMLKEYESFFDISAKFMGDRADAFVKKLEDVRVDLANASNPIRFEDEKQAAVFGAAGAKYAHQSIFIICVSVVVFCFGYWGYSIFNQQKQIENLRLDKPTIYKEYFTK